MERLNLCKEVLENAIGVHRTLEKIEPLQPLDIVAVQAMEELLQYKTAEEQGLLLRLPCKVGDKAYYLHKGGIDEVEVDSFVLNINLFVNVSYYIGCDRFGKTLTPYKTLFFTREEAERALEQMK